MLILGVVVYGAGATQVSFEAQRLKAMVAHGQMCPELGGAPLSKGRMMREWFSWVGEVALLGSESWMVSTYRYEDMEVWQ